jgi:hypothetical protein
MRGKFKGKKTPEVFRVCAVCGKRHGPIYGFRNTLAYHGIKGDKATVECVRNLSLRGNQRSADNGSASD